MSHLHGVVPVSLDACLSLATPLGRALAARFCAPATKPPCGRTLENPPHALPSFPFPLRVLLPPSSVLPAL
eukprot:scaffold3187_cov1181-Pavlova_lutheri.AAC.1